ncbi:MAG: C-terminal binding protein [Chloroflexota bacterium]
MADIRGLIVTRPGVQDVSLPREAFEAVGGELEHMTNEDEGAVIEALKDVDVCIGAGWRPGRRVFEEMDRCKGVVSMGHGFDGWDLQAATDNGIILANTASFGTEEVSNHAMMLLLVCSRKFVLHDKLVRQGVWTREHLPPMGHISGQTLGIIGVGNIGRAVGRKARAFGLRVLAYDPYVPSWDFKEYGFEEARGMDQVLEESDYLTLHTPLNDETYHMMGGPQFSKMKNTAYLINVSRGKVVDEPALVEALRNGQIAGAGLDVFEQEPTPADNPLLQMDNVAVTNHYASYSEVAFQRAFRQMGQEAVRIAKGDWPMSLINPDVASKVPPRPPAKAWSSYASGT